MNKISELVTSEQIIAWLLIALLVVYFTYKEWPEVKKRLSKTVKHEQTEASMETRLSKIEENITSINDKLNRDFDNLKETKDEIERQKHRLEESLEEREILMRSMLGVLRGMQELGANGPTKEAQREIEIWLSRQAHQFEE